MPEIFAPIIINRTIRNLTFYSMEGRNFVRKKSSLTRRKVLYSPEFKHTRHYAGLMGRASKIGSLVYNALPANWRQSWMYRSFTGEAFTMLKAGKKEDEIQRELWKRYVEIVVNKQPQEAVILPLITQPKGTYRKLDSAYWKNKTVKSARQKARRQQVKYYAGLMAQASKIGSKLNTRLPGKYASRRDYQYLTGLALKLLKEQISEQDILTQLLPTQDSEHRSEEIEILGEPQVSKKNAAAVVQIHQKRRLYFIPSLHKRFSMPAKMVLCKACFGAVETVNFVSPG